jgi:proline iminopeptidase
MTVESATDPAQVISSRHASSREVIDAHREGDRQPAVDLGDAVRSSPKRLVTPGREMVIMTTLSAERLGRGTRMSIRDVSLFVQVVGCGYPVVLMHGGPGLDHWSLRPFRRLADRFTLVFYDHRCNGRSTGAPLESMSWENLTADADELRQRLGFDRWAVLGHSFGGHVALEYALRYPHNLSHLVLLDTGGDGRWSQQNAAEVLAKRGYSPTKVALVRRWFNGEFAPREFFPIFMRIGGAYSHGPFVRVVIEDVIHGGWRAKMRKETFIFAGRHLIKGWTVLDRLGGIEVPTLVMAGRDDFVFPPECQDELVAGIRGARLRLIARAGHNPQDEQPAEVMEAVSEFIGPAGGR